MNVLLIDTSSNQEIRVGLRINGETSWLRKSIDHQKAQVVLPLIDKLLTKKNIKIGDLDDIEVNTRAGSFTGVRVGLSVANALGLSLGIPVKKVIY